MYTNTENVPLALAVWLAADNYDLEQAPNTISATGLLRPIKASVLASRMAEEGLLSKIDIMDRFRSRLGTAVHDASEAAWINNVDTALKALGYPPKVRKNVVVNPHFPVEDPNKIIVFLEQRNSKEIDGWTISGKFDFCLNGQVQDIKTTKAFNWIKKSHEEDYRRQGSIYRWLNPEIITNDHMQVLYVFTDWNPYTAQTDKQYPPKAIMPKTLPLWTLDETEHWIRSRLQTIELESKKSQDDMTSCTPKELWQKPSAYAWYSKPNAKRATRVFDTQMEAERRKAQAGGAGIIRHRPGEVVRCNYCPAKLICQQAEGYKTQGLLK